MNKTKFDAVTKRNSGEVCNQSTETLTVQEKWQQLEEMLTAREEWQQTASRKRLMAQVFGYSSEEIAQLEQLQKYYDAFMEVYKSGADQKVLDGMYENVYREIHFDVRSVAREFDNPVGCTLSYDDSEILDYFYTKIRNEVWGGMLDNEVLYFGMRYRDSLEEAKKELIHTKIAY